MAKDLAEVTKLAEDWAKHDTAASGTRVSQQSAEADGKSVSARVAHAARAATQAEVVAGSIQAQVSTKTLP